VPRRLALAAALVIASAVLLAVAGGAAGRSTGSSATPSARVGAFYFDGWAGALSNFHFDGLAHPASNGAFFPGRRPLSGWRDHTPEALQAQLRWARAAGIDFFVFDWYREGVGDSYFTNAAHDKYLKLGDRAGVGFALMYVSHEPFGVPLDEWPAVVEKWVTRDFADPDYVRIGGKPMLVIYETHRVAAQWGGAQGVNRAIEILQETAKRHGLPGVFVVGARQDYWDYSRDCVLNCGYDGDLLEQNYDALTKYTFNLVVEPVDGPMPYSRLVAAEKRNWERYAQQSRFPYIPSVVAGWDPRPADSRFDGRLYWLTRSPAEVGGFLRDAIDWVERNPQMRVEPAPVAPVVLIEAWNELQEGAHVVPVDEHGYTYVQAIAEAVGIPWTAPPKHTLRVSPSTRGSVKSKPAGIACPPTCTAGFDEGLEVTLTAAAKRRSTFDRWSGRCTEDLFERACPVVLVRHSTVKPLLTATVQRRALTVRLSGAIARGKLSALDGYANCAKLEPIQIQRRRGNSWVRIASTLTDQRGRYAVTLRNRPGTYRALVPRSDVGDHACLAATSPLVTSTR